jgi:hypothetical protein
VRGRGEEEEEEEQEGRLWLTADLLQAEANKVKIVHTCGFDSIPSDMGTCCCEPGVAV